MAEGNAVAASFRDPDSTVFERDGRILRGLSETGAHDWAGLADTGLVDRLVSDGLLVGTTVVDAAGLVSPRGVPTVLTLEHERIPFVSYPYEWPFAMMRDAALCHLDVLLAALDAGMTLKDGTAYNVQFRGVDPVFIDIGSFEPATGPWPGYRQFCQTMLFPLLVQAHLGIAFQPLLRGSVDGLTPTDVAGMFKGRRKWKKGVFKNVTLHAIADRKVTSGTESMKSELKQSGFGVELTKATARKLRKTVSRLEVDRRGSTWSDYRTSCSYSDDDASAKRTFVAEVLDRIDPACVLDLGANDGAYSLLAAETADLVVAVDFDEAVIDGLARRLKADGVTNVLPLVNNLVDPSPGLGWRNRERTAFEDRADADLALALALVHHLAISANIPMPEIAQWLHDLGAPVVVEFVHRDDVMVERLLANKPSGLFDDYRRDHFEELVGARFRVSRSQTLPGGTRTLYALDPR